MLSASYLALSFVALFAGLSAASTDRRATTGRTTAILRNFPGQVPLPSLTTLSNSNATGDVLDLTNIQGDILIGMKKPFENFYFFSISNATAFKQVVRSDILPLVTSTATLIGPVNQQPLAYVNIAFSQTGLTALNVTDSLGDQDFSFGQFANATSVLGDDTSTWEDAFKGTSIHGVFLVGSDNITNIQSTINPVISALEGAASVVYELDGAARPGDEAGHEHFGFLDGISQPGVQGFTNVSVPLQPGQSLVPTGTILVGESGDCPGTTSNNCVPVARPAWAKDGSFLAFRKLQQLVPEFNKFLLDNAVQNSDGNLTVEQGAEIFGSRLVGRFPSGAPIDIVGQVDDPALGGNPTLNNNFNFSDDPTGEKCPFSAHIRKTRPRADLATSTAAEDLTHHGIRAGIPYGPEVTDSEAYSNTTTVDRGLAFVMYQSNLSNGFAFLQQIWADNFNFRKPNTGLDPIIGQNGSQPRTWFGTDPSNLNQSFTELRTVIPTGGEYFFSPSISALNNTILALE